MTGCFICDSHKNHGKFTVGVWEATTKANLFGLGSVDPTDGIVCCSFREGEFNTLAEAQEAASETNAEEMYYEKQVANSDY